MADGTGLISRVRQHARDAPEALSVTWAGKTLTRAELVNTARSVAGDLTSAGVRAGDVVALSADLSGQIVPSLLACWSLSATPWPFDSRTPVPRLVRMGANAQPAAVVLPEVADVPAPLSHLPRVAPTSTHLTDADWPLGTGRFAYLLFTSGSSGEPKGVVMPMEGLERLTEWQAAQHRGGAVGQFAARTFDVAQQEIALALWAGAELVVFSDEERRDPRVLAERVRSRGVETLFLPTAALTAFCESLADERLEPLRHVVVAGEALRISGPARAFFAANPWCALHNHYGPTETHVVVAHSLGPDPAEWPDLPPIGSPLPGVGVEVVRDGVAMADGEVGELVVNGPRVAAGYLHGGTVRQTGGFQPDLGRPSYATGDLVYWKDGGLMYAGRADSQVKIRGHRVEPAEVEAVLERHPAVRRCVVAAVDRGSHSELAAYLVTGDDGVPDPGAPMSGGNEFAEWCRRELPEPMVPTLWMRLARLPMTGHGKVDRQSLPIPTRKRPAVWRPAVPAATETERVVAAVWSDVLGLPEVGVTDEFALLGGTSLEATRILAGLQHQLSPDVRAVDVFGHPTVRAFSTAHDATGVHRALGERRRTRVAPGRAPSTSEGSAVAVVGMACRFPGACDVAQFWDNVMARRDTITRGRHDPERPHHVSASGRIPDIDRFDAEYFGLSDNDAARIDPQQRLLLELAVTAFEDAGLPAAKRRRTGVFAGTGPSTYLLNNLLPTLPARPARNLVDSVDELELLISNDKDYAAARISYALDLHGPAYAVNAACATGLAAVHAARRALLAGDCDIALAGAASVSSPEVQGYDYEPGLMYSPDGYCRPFSRDAAGTVFSSGAAVVVLRRLQDAVADGDEIYAIIEGSAVGNDGRRKLGMTAPSAAAQAEVIRQAWREAGISPKHLAMVEAHGTATSVGDAIEVEALLTALGEQLSPRSCAVGSVKGNIGHLGWAAGLAGLIKAVLSVSHRVIPPTLYAEDPAEPLTRPGSPLFTPTAAVPWPEGRSRLAAVSSFGLGGANAHVVLSGHDDKAPDGGAEPAGGDRSTVVYPVSAKNPGSLRRLLGDSASFIQGYPSPRLAAATAARRRDHHSWRVAVVGDSAARLANELRRVAVPSGPVGPVRIGFVFAGQGFSRPGMGRDLYVSEPVFKEAIDALADPFRRLVSHDLLKVLGYDSTTESDLTDRGSIAVVQPLIYCFQLALVDLWASWGVRPAVVLGHSLGEFSAAATAGVFSRVDGLRVVAERGRLLATLPDGVGMAAVRAGRHDVDSIVDETRVEVEIAAVNAPRSVAVAGAHEELDRFARIAAARGIDVTRLAISRAGHSSHMDPVLTAFGAAFDGVRLQPPTIPLVSNVTGSAAGREVCDPAYWQRHLREPVQFAAGVASALEFGADRLVEISGHPTLVPLIDAAMDDSEPLAVATLRRDQPDEEAFAEAIATLYESGADLDWNRGGTGAAARARIPTYPFAGVRHWIGAVPPPIPGREPMRASLPQLQALSLRPDRTPRCWLLRGDARTAEPLAMELRQRGHRVVCAPDHTAGADQPGADDNPDEVVVLAQPGARGAADLEPCLRVVVDLAATGTRAAVTFVRCDGDGWVNAAVLGVGRVAATEGAFTRTRLVSVQPQTPTSLLVDALEDPTVEEVVLDHSSASAAIWRAAELPAQSSWDAGTGVHVILGGTRGLGLWTAEQLVEAGAKRLVLMGRRAPSGNAATRIERLQQRATVEVLTIDLLDSGAPDALDRAVGDHALAGVVLSVGHVDDALLPSASWPQLHSVLLPKIDGLAQTIAWLSKRTDPPSFVLLYSSVAAALGTVGQAAHAAANSALNAAAAHLRSQGFQAIAVGWGPWSDEGYLTDRPDTVAQLLDAGFVPMNRLRAEGLIGRLLALSVPQIDLIDVDWAKYAATLPGPIPARFARLRADEATGPCAPSVPHEAPLVGDVRATLIALLTERLGRAPRMDRSLSEESVDSLGVTRLRNAISRKLGLRLRAIDLTSALTIEHLAATLEERAQERCAAEPTADRPPVIDTRRTATDPSPEQEYAPSFQQRRWRSLVVEAGYGHRVVPVFFPQELDASQLHGALHDVVARHDGLRAVFRTVDTVATIPADDAVPPLEHLVATGGLSDEVRRLRAHPQDVTSTVSWTARAVPLPGAHALLLSLQHLDFDGTGISVFLDELAAAYAGRLLDAEPPSYRAFAEWQRQEHEARSTEVRALLQGLYTGVSAPTLLPGRTDLAVTRAFPSERYTPHRDQRLTTAELAELARSLGTSMFSLVTAAYGRALAQWFNLGEISVTSILSGRSEERFDRLIGPLTSPWPLPVPLAPLGLAPAARLIARTAALLTELASFCPSSMATEQPAFAGLPSDTYFSDVGINFTSYQRQRSYPDSPQVVEILGPVEHPLLDSADFAPLLRPTGVHLIFDVSGPLATPSVWFHTDRFSASTAAGIVDSMHELLRRAQKEQGA